MEHVPCTFVMPLTYNVLWLRQRTPILSKPTTRLSGPKSSLQSWRSPRSPTTHTHSHTTGPSHRRYSLSSSMAVHTNISIFSPVHSRTRFFLCYYPHMLNILHACLVFSLHAFRCLCGITFIKPSAKICLLSGLLR